MCLYKAGGIAYVKKKWYPCISHIDIHMIYTHSLHQMYFEFRMELLRYVLHEHLVLEYIDSVAAAIPI